MVGGMGPKAFVPSIYCPWPLFTLQDLAEKSPTRLYRNAEGISKGLSQKREDDQIKTAFELMGDAGDASICPDDSFQGLACVLLVCSSSEFIQRLRLHAKALIIGRSLE